MNYEKQQGAFTNSVSRISFLGVNFQFCLDPFLKFVHLAGSKGSFISMDGLLHSVEESLWSNPSLLMFLHFQFFRVIMQDSILY